VLTEQQKRVEQPMPAPTSRYRLPGLQDARARAYLTQRELAEQSGVATSTVARIEQGYPASLITARKLADALGVTLRELREAPKDE